LNAFTKTLHKVTAQPFVQYKGFAIISINFNQQLSISKEGVDLMKGKLSIKLLYFMQGVCKGHTES